MKKTYSVPTLKDFRLACSSFLMISGGGKGSEGDDADSKRFWGGSIFDDTDEDKEEDLGF